TALLGVDGRLDGLVGLGGGGFVAQVEDAGGHHVLPVRGLQRGADHLGAAELGQQRAEVLFGGHVAVGGRLRLEDRVRLVVARDGELRTLREHLLLGQRHRVDVAGGDVAWLRGRAGRRLRALDGTGAVVADHEVRAEPTGGVEDEYSDRGQQYLPTAVRWGED